MHKKLRSEIDVLILNDRNATFTVNGYSLNYHDLGEGDQQHLAALIVEDDDRDLTCISDNLNASDIVSSLLAMLKNDTHESDDDFASVIKKSLRAHYATRAQELIDERCEQLTSDDDADHGGFRMTDRKTGERHFIRI